MKKLAVLISGNGSNLEAIMEACNKGNIHGEMICVISNNPSAYGIERATKFKIPTKIIDHKNYLFVIYLFVVQVSQFCLFLYQLISHFYFFRRVRSLHF